MTIGAHDSMVNNEAALLASTNQLLEEKNYLKTEIFREQLILTYQKKLLKKIAKILAGAEEITTALETLLQENWDLAKGTYLWYTVHSEDSLTELLCDIAQYVRQSPLSVLMLGIAIDNADDAYPDLTTELNVAQIVVVK